MLDLSFDFPDQNWACFDCVRLMFRLSGPKLGMFRLCSTYVLTFPTKIGHVLIVVELCFDFPDQNRACARLMFWLSRPKLGMCLTYVSFFQTKIEHVLDLCFDFPDQNWICFSCARFVFDFPDQNWGYFDSAWPIFRLSRPKLCMWSTYVSTF